ncbi:MAG TPA: hypothetical protein VFC51_19830 [Chloroflexota bacterium]|nr:hypothetical protein [Chloroflexota bacterium]
MDPVILSTDQWLRLSSSLRFLVLFVGLVVNTAISFLFAHAVIPSLVGSGDLPPGAERLRGILYPISAVSAALTIVAFSVSIAGFVAVIMQFYPRFAI